MKIYIYDKITGEFLNEYYPQINPKRPNEYIYPPNSTTLAPSKKKGYIPVFKDGEWIFVEDFRGEGMVNIYTKECSMVSELGPLPDGFMLFDDYEETDMYKKEQEEIWLQEQKSLILSEIEELDKKRIRAICEPEQRTENQTWLEYYTEQIIVLRNKLREF